jgi:ketosteroid isomerase-like protein
MRVNKVRAAVALALVAAMPPLLAHEPSAAAARAASLPAAARGAAATVDAFHAALHRGDTRAAAALLADDALIFESGGVERSKAEYAEHHLPADTAFSQAVTSVVKHRSGNVAGTLAWIASEGATTGTYKGKALNLVTTETMVLRRVGSVWRIIHIHWSSEQ